MWEIISLIGLIIFRYEAAIIGLGNRGFSFNEAFTLLSIGMVFTTFAVYYLSGPRFIPRQIHFPQAWVAWLQKKRIVRSYLSYRVSEKTRKERMIGVLVRIVAKIVYGIGYIGIALVAMVPFPPLLRSATVIAVRVANLKYGVYVILGSAEIKLYLELLVYYRYGKTIPLVSKLSALHIAVTIIGIVVLYTVIGWFYHAITDNHFSRNRFS
ncbi:MAG: hypothetical protein ABIH38_05660 [Patescibacteria group bacterium]